MELEGRHLNTELYFCGGGRGSPGEEEQEDGPGPRHLRRTSVTQIPPGNNSIIFRNYGTAIIIYNSILLRVTELIATFLLTLKGLSNQSFLFYFAINKNNNSSY